MKKRCTNSSCRKVFSVNPIIRSCPHCGKEYPRMIPAKARTRKERKRGESRLSAYITLKDLKLSECTTACLKRAGYQNAADILLAGFGPLRQARGFEKKSIAEIVNKLSSMGYDCAELMEGKPSEFTLDRDSVPQRVSSDYSERITLRSGKCVSVEPMCVNGVYLPMGRVFKQFDEILNSEKENNIKLALLKALRAEFSRLTGDRLVLGLKGALDIVLHFMACGQLPIKVHAAREEFTRDRLHLRDMTLGDSLSAPEISNRGKPRRKH